MNLGSPISLLLLLFCRRNHQTSCLCFIQSSLFSFLSRLLDTPHNGERHMLVLLLSSRQPFVFLILKVSLLLPLKGSGTEFVNFTRSVVPIKVFSLSSSLLTQFIEPFTLWIGRIVFFRWKGCIRKRWEIRWALDYLDFPTSFARWLAYRGWWCLGIATIVALLLAAHGWFVWF